MNIIDDDKSFGIDVGTRDVAYSGEGKIRLIQGDHNSERITFSMNRYVEQYDMSQCDKVEIHYINISSSGKERSEGVYTVADVEINPTSENEIVFSWLVSVNATRYAGSVNFLILFRNVDAEGNVTYSWSTALNKEIIIGEGMNCGDDFEEAYSDILAQWEKKVAADIKADAMADEIKQNKTDDALTTKDKTVVGAINETHSKAWDAMSAAETALSNTSVNEMLMGSLDNLTTQEKSTIVGAINEINSNKQAEDFVVTGEIEVVGGDSTKLLEGVNISATYEEIVEAYNAKKNVIFAPFVTEVNATLRVPLLSYANETILFSGVDYEGNTFMFVCQSDNTWNGKWYSLVKGDEYFFTTLCAVQRRSNNELYFLGKSNSGEDIIEEYKKGKQVRLLVSELVDKSYLKLGYFELTETDESTYCIFSRNVGLNTYFRIHVTLDTYKGNYFTFPLSSDVQENYIITCTASDGVERINGKELYIDNVSTTFEEIINAYEEGKNIKLLFDYEGSDIIADFVIKAGADDIGFCVTIPYLGFIQIDCHPYNGWSGNITYVVKKNEINNLETQIGDINTALETALNGGDS